MIQNKVTKGASASKPGPSTTKSIALGKKRSNPGTQKTQTPKRQKAALSKEAPKKRHSKKDSSSSDSYSESTDSSDSDDSSSGSSGCSSDSDCKPSKVHVSPSKKKKSVVASEDSDQSTAPKKTKSAIKKKNGESIAAANRPCFARHLKYERATVAMTGAKPGDVLEGVTRSKGTKLLVSEGNLPASASVLAELGSAGLALLAQTWGISEAEASAKVADLPKDDFAHHLALGKGCRCREASCCTACPVTAKFQILELGPLATHAAEAGRLEELEDMMRSNSIVGWGDILRLCGKHFLSLSRSCFFVADEATAVLAQHTDGLTLVLDTTSDHFGSIVTMKASPLSTQQLRLVDPQTKLAVLVPVSCSALTLDEVLVCVKRVVGDSLHADVDIARDVLGRAPPGKLKAALQKSIRFGAKSVRVSIAPPLGPDEPVEIDTIAFAAVSFAVLCVHAGIFVPELQMFTRGCTAAFKRLAVILTEDAWVPHAPLAALLGTALVCQRNPSWYPSLSLVEVALRTCVRAVRSPLALSWAPPPADRKRGRDACDYKCAKPFSYVPFEPASENTEAIAKAEQPIANELATAAFLLAVVGSFAGDEHMMNALAVDALRKGGVRFVSCKFRAPEVMPLEHVIDQHCDRGIGHAMPGSAEFVDKFGLLFGSFTGQNPRRTPFDAEALERAARSKGIRAAQALALVLAVRSRSVSLHPHRLCEPAALARNTASVVIKVPVDPGALAAAVGPQTVSVGPSKQIPRKTSLIVTLGTSVPEDVVVMRPPSRSSTDLYGVVTDAERAAAAEVLQAKRFPLSASPIPLGGKFAVFADARWHITDSANGKGSGLPWDQVRPELSVTVSVSPAPADATLRDRGQLFLHLMTHCNDDGVTEGALPSRVRALATETAPNVLLRVLSLVRQRYKTVDFPVPGLDGRRGADEYASYAEDADAYTLLLRVSALVPGAVRPTTVPRFAVPNAMLLREVERVLALAVQEKCSGRGGQASSTAVDKASAVQETGSGRGGQASSTAADKANASIGTFGGGVKQSSGAEPAGGQGQAWTEFVGGLACKHTLRPHQRDAVACMEHRVMETGSRGHFLVMDTGLGKTLTAVSFLRRMGQLGRLPSNVLWVIPSAAVDDIIKELRRCGAPATHLPAHGVPVAHHFNVVKHDRLRVVLPTLLQEAPRTAIVFDEVDTCYAKTLRTSAAHQLASLSPMFVLQTATPMRNTNHTELANWLALIVDYPLDGGNWYVAANAIIAKQIELGIEVEYVEERVAPSPSLANPAGPYRAALDARKWAAAARVVWDKLDARLVDAAVREAKSVGGALVEARDEDHRSTLLGLLSARGEKCGGLEDGPNQSVPIVVVRSNECRGYNWAVRLGALVRGVYPGNAADRHQMVGRLRRITQKRTRVRVVTVTMAGTIVDALLATHTSADSVNLSLEALADRYPLAALLDSALEKAKD